MSKPKIEDIAEMEFDKLLQQVRLGELNVVDSHTDEQQDMSKQLLGIVSKHVRDGTP